MKKLPILVVSAIALGGAAVPLWFGNQAEAQFRKELNLFATNPSVSRIASVELVEYEKGWLTAKAKTRVVFTPSGTKASGDQFELVFDTDIQHGPFAQGSLVAGVMETRLLPPPEYADKAAFYFGDKSPLYQHTVIGLDGQSVTQVVIPPYSGRDYEDKSDIEWQGLNGTIHGDFTSKRFQGELSIPLYSSRSDAGMARFQGMSVTSDGRMGNHNMVVGEGTFSIEEVSVVMPDKQDVHWHGISVMLKSDQEENLANIHEELSFEKLSGADGGDIGPGNVVIDMRNLDSAAMEEMNAELAATAPVGLPPEQAAAQVKSVMKRYSQKLLKASPELDIGRCHIVMPQGDVDATLFVGFNGEQDFNMLIPQTMTPLLTVDFNVSAPVALVTSMVRSRVRQQLLTMLEQNGQTLSQQDLDQGVESALGMQLKMFEGMNFIVPENGNYRTHLRFNANHLTLNDKPADHLLGGLSGKAL